MTTARRTSERYKEVDILIVGAGPTGLYGAYYAGFRGLTVAVIDILPQIGGQVCAMYPEKPIFDVPGLPAVKGRQLVDNLATQAAEYRPTYFLGQQAIALSYEGDRAVVHTSAQTVIRAGAVIICGGIGTFTPRPLTVAARFEGRGLAYFVRDPEYYRDTDVVIAGGGDSAFDWALTLEPLARSITLVHRRDRFRAHAGSVAAAQASSVEILVNSAIAEVAGDTTITSAQILNVSDGTIREVKAQAIIAALGFTANLGPLADWGIAMNTRNIVVDTHMATNLPRVYAAGDITDYPGKVRLISVGFGEVATAVNNAAAAMDPDAALFPGHSTDNAPASAGTAEKGR